MKPLLKRIGWSLLAAILLAVSVVWIGGGMIVNKRHTVPQARNVILSSRPDIIAEGERLAQVYGCFGGCHGDDMQGLVMFEQFMMARIAAPNLGSAMQRYSPDELEIMIRQGVRPDGRSLVIMPSAGFSTMTDHDLSSILSFIQSFPQQDQDPGTMRIGLGARLFFLLGKFKTEIQKGIAEPANGLDRSDPLVNGGYLAGGLCGECHGAKLDGEGGFAPDLVIARGYDLEAFRKLMTEGLGIGDRELGLMTEVAKRRFAHLNGSEISDLHAYLQAR